MVTRSKRDELMSYISDAHKDAYGFRPSSDSRSYYARMSIAELEAEADKLSLAVGEAIKEEDAQRARNAEIFEARIASIIEAGAGDRATAIRWDRESHDDLHVLEDIGYYCYKNGLSYSYFTNDPAVKKVEISS